MGSFGLREREYKRAQKWEFWGVRHRRFGASAARAVCRQACDLRFLLSEEWRGGCAWCVCFFEGEKQPQNGDFCAWRRACFCRSERLAKVNIDGGVQQERRVARTIGKVSGKAGDRIREGWRQGCWQGKGPATKLPARLGKLTAEPMAKRLLRVVRCHCFLMVRRAALPLVEFGVQHAEETLEHLKRRP